MHFVRLFCRSASLCYKKPLRKSETVTKVQHKLARGKKLERFNKLTRALSENLIQVFPNRGNYLNNGKKCQYYRLVSGATRCLRSCHNSGCGASFVGTNRCGIDSLSQYVQFFHDGWRRSKAVGQFRTQCPERQ